MRAIERGRPPAPRRSSELTGTVMTEWFEHDTFWEAMGPAMFNEALWAAAPRQIDDIQELLGLDPPADVLDLACGSGRHALELARRNFEVTGVDRTSAYLEEAEEHARAEGLEIEWLEADMREFRRESSFELALLMYSSIGLFDERTSNRRVLEHCRASLESGAPLVVETMGKEVLARDFHPRTWEELDDGSLFLDERQPIDGWERLRNRWIRIHPDGRRERFELDIRLYAGSELEHLLREAGFGSVELYGSLDGRPYDREAERLVAVARSA